MLVCLIYTFLPYVCYSSYRSLLNSCFLITSVILSDERAALECEWLEQIVKDQSLLQRRFETSESGRTQEMLLLLGIIDAVHQQRVRMRFVLLHSWLFLESTTNWSGFPEQIGYWPLCSFFEEPELSGRLRNEVCHVAEWSLPCGGMKLAMWRLRSDAVLRQQTGLARRALLDSRCSSCIYDSSFYVGRHRLYLLQACARRSVFCAWDKSFRCSASCCVHAETLSLWWFSGQSCLQR